MQSDPKVSVIISAYGAEDYIEECISSVASQSYFQENNFAIEEYSDGAIDRIKSTIDGNLVVYSSTHFSNIDQIVQDSFERIINKKLK